MKRIFLILSIVLGSLTTLLAQSSREDFIKARKSSYESSKKAKREEFTAFSEKQNEDFVKHLNEQWTLLENYKKENMPLSKPKPKDVPVVPDYVDNDIDVDNDVIIDIDIDTDADRENDIVVEDDNKGDDNILVKSKDLVEFNFYGEKVAVVVDEKLRLTLNGVDEASIANYFATISQYREATKLLWTDLTKKANTFGLNDWGKFVMVRKLSEQLFDNHNDCVLFCFYMLRNEGGKKVRIARGGVSNKLLMLMSVEESRILYKYSYFNFTEENADVKYYLVYRATTEPESIYTYDVNEQDLMLSPINVDFDNVLMIGKCDKMRKLAVKKMNTTVDLPFNSRNIEFLKDMPLTNFPVYFGLSMTDEARKVLDDKFATLKYQYSIGEATNILLNFVQTAFDYKTDDDQFGYEKYFYPEELVAYPYSDCEDRSAMFGWLVKEYLGLPVVALSYPNHLATAVYFGEQTAVSGDYVMFDNKKYYVCDPTYIGASIGMAMRDFKNVTPEIIVLK